MAIALDVRFFGTQRRLGVRLTAVVHVGVCLMRLFCVGLVDLPLVFQR